MQATEPSLIKRGALSRQDERRGDEDQGGGWYVRIDHVGPQEGFLAARQAEGGRRNMQSITAVKQRLVRPVIFNPLRTGQPADRMMDDDHSMKDEAAKVEDIEGQEEQHGVEREEPTLEDRFGSFAEDETRVHDGGLGQDVVAVEAEPAHGSLDTEEEGVVPRVSQTSIGQQKRA